MNEVQLIPLLDTIQYIEMSDEEYFSDKYSDYISNSKLSLINPSQDGSPEKYLEGLSKNQTFSESLVFGSAVHQLILQPNEFMVVDSVNKPTAKMGAMADYLYNYYIKGKVTPENIIEASNVINYYKDKMDDIKIQNVLDKCSSYWKDRKNFENKDYTQELIYLDTKSRDKLKLCVNSVNNNQEIQNLLHPKGFIDDPISMNEAALFINIKAIYNNKETILKLKAKLDNFTIDLESNSIVLNDLKTTGHYLTKFGESFEKYHYFRQMGFYLWLLTLYAKKEYNIQSIDSLKANMLLVSTIPDFRSGVFKVSKKQINRGFKEFSDLLSRVAKLTLEC